MTNYDFETAKFQILQFLAFRFTYSTKNRIVLVYSLKLNKNQSISYFDTTINEKAKRLNKLEVPYYFESFYVERDNNPTQSGRLFSIIMFHLFLVKAMGWASSSFMKMYYDQYSANKPNDDDRRK